MPQHILIVDPSEAVRRATRHYLEIQPGFEVCGEAVDGCDALQKLHYLKPDAIILDLAMPSMDGLQTAREIRAMMICAPIILFTFFADAVPAQTALAAGINVVVSKTSPDQLSQNIKMLLPAP